jgi:outer membrane protein insertion porin family
VESQLALNRTRRTIASSSRIDDRSGVSWEQKIRLVRNLQLAYGYRFEHSQTELPPDPLLGPFPPIVLNVARLTSTAAWDTRNDPANTVIGALVSSAFEWGPERAGSDIRFVRELVQAYYFRPWRGVVFASAARFGVVQPLGGQELVTSERFFAGGPRTVRGVAEESLGERDFFGLPKGGEALLVLNQEARFPIYGWVGGVVFFDAGNVFQRPKDLRFGDLVQSTGFGVRIATPFALLRIDYARANAGGPVVRSGSFIFGIGQAF